MGPICQSPRRSEADAINSMAGETVTINLNDHISNKDNGNDLCYNITASNGIKQVVVQDILSIKITDSTTSYVAAITVSIILAIILSLLVVGIVLPIGLMVNYDNCSNLFRSLTLYNFLAALLV